MNVEHDAGESGLKKKCKKHIEEEVLKREKKNKPHGVEYVTILSYSKQFVGYGNGVHVTVFSIVKISIRSPDPLEHFYAQA